MGVGGESRICPNGIQATLHAKGFMTLILTAKVDCDVEGLKGGTVRSTETPGLHGSGPTIIFIIIIDIVVPAGRIQQLCHGSVKPLPIH